MTNHAIIIEGPDGSGKTTLAHALCEQLDREYRRPPPEVLDSAMGPQGDGLPTWWDSELSMLPSYHKQYIYDRCFYISDPIYQMAQPERKLLVPGDRLMRGTHKLWAIEPIIIFCLPDFEVQLSNVRQESRPRLAGVSDRALEKISNAYWSFYSLWDQALFGNVRRYNYKYRNEFELLLDYLKGHY